MILTQHATSAGPRWALDGEALHEGFTLSAWLSLSGAAALTLLTKRGSALRQPFLPPIEGGQEVWASGVTYRRSLVEREAESVAADVYARVYEAERPEIFFKALGTRVAGHREPIRIRKDSAWNVPEPELVLVINSAGEIVGYTAGNDVSSRSIEGENPLYLPQAKCYDGACALGPGIVLVEDPGEQPIKLSILRDGREVFAGEANTSQMKRQYRELVEHLYREMTFPNGAFLMTGTGIVPTAEFTLQTGDEVSITVGELTLNNPVA